MCEETSESAANRTNRRYVAGILIAILGCVADLFFAGIRRSSCERRGTCARISQGLEAAVRQSASGCGTYFPLPLDGSVTNRMLL
jgi:hypothetical protein